MSPQLRRNLSFDREMVIEEESLLLSKIQIFDFMAAVTEAKKQAIGAKVLHCPTSYTLN